jgi:acetylornithine deacetylase/succinyl-diaminopimelate desuccinylase-like protein
MTKTSAADTLKELFPQYLDDLKALARIPSISFPGFPEAEVRRSAEATAELLRKRGFENVEILEIPGAHPYVYGERLRAPGKPTLLLYAHHDVQPPGRAELWKTPPFEPTLAEGPGGMRLYGRGTADDKAGILVHAAAVDATLRAGGELPVNVKIVVEGEEEIGSGHLGAFLKAYRKKLDADVLVLTDTTNFDCGVPALTVALRGMVALEVEVRSLTKSVHSGMWGGPVPDPVQGLAKMLAGLLDENGRIAVPGIWEQVPPLTPGEVERMKEIPFDEKAFRDACGMVAGTRLLLEGPNAHAQTWRFPSLTVTAIQASSRAQAANIINDAAWAKVTVRLSGGMDPAKTSQALQDYLRKRRKRLLKKAMGRNR